ncbi:N-6 DNA methylase [Stenotrophomonas sp. Iso1]|uniref:N-6 DNA methylase n=1 Tax=Stenotrophomonas sp. Iso1 TaxID=2977283 RepID=UPI0022B7831F|nr:N-6 DNA methylase [Stenotrophomonas sp. Iso1]
MTLEVNNSDTAQSEGFSPTTQVTDARALKRALGAYYTPDHLSAVVTSWAIQDPSDRVLEPGFGGCGFLMAAKVRLESLGQRNAHEYIHGCDIDKAAFDHLREVFNATPSEEHFPHIDFLRTQPGSSWEGARFSVALGNPPYVSYQALGEKRATYQAALATSGWPGLSARASLWAYFVLHALSYLEEEGRVAWVLPGSLMRADYSKYVKHIYASHFSKSALFHVHERLFGSAGADEETVVLVAEGYSAIPYDRGAEFGITERAVETVEDLAAALANWSAETDIQQSCQPRAGKLLQAMNKLPTCPLGDLLTARIGLVTGDNAFFLFSKQRAHDAGVPLDLLTPVFAKGAMAPGLSFGKPEIHTALSAGRPCLLLSWDGTGRPNTAIERYLQSYPSEKIAKVSTFKKRRVWHDPIQAEVPDAFWPVMRDLGPKLVLNPQKLHCTNTIHRVFFKQGLAAIQRKQIAICLQTSYAQLYAEICGRSYGSGVLKHEPRDVEQIRIPWPNSPDASHTRDTFTLLDMALRSGKNQEAMDIADNYVGIYAKLAYGQAQRTAIREELMAARRARMPIGNRNYQLIT